MLRRLHLANDHPRQPYLLPLDPDIADVPLSFVPTMGLGVRTNEQWPSFVRLDKGAWRIQHGIYMHERPRVRAYNGAWCRNERTTAE